MVGLYPFPPFSGRVVQGIRSVTLLAVQGIAQRLTSSTFGCGQLRNLRHDKVLRGHAAATLGVAEDAEQVGALAQLGQDAAHLALAEAGFGDQQGHPGTGPAAQLTGVEGEALEDVLGGVGEHDAEGGALLAVAHRSLGPGMAKAGVPFRGGEAAGLLVRRLAARKGHPGLRFASPVTTLSEWPPAGKGDAQGAVQAPTATRDQTITTTSTTANPTATSASAVRLGAGS